MRLGGVCCIMVLGLLISTGGAAAQNPGQSDQIITGEDAWREAKTYGFVFRPEPRTYETVTSPYDGVNTRLLHTSPGTRTSVTKARIVSGAIETQGVSQGNNKVTYRMFYGKKLSPDWTIHKIVLEGDYTFEQAPRLDTDDASYRVTVTGYSTVAGLKIKNITLRGPTGADWRDAFSAVRKSFTVPGILAWSTAKQYGFEFYPVNSVTSCYRVSDPRDGVKTELIPWWNNCRGEIVASVVAGNMIVNAPNSTQKFLMFAAKKLAPGWKIKEVKVSPATITWVRPPKEGSDDMSFELSRTSYGSPVSAFVTSVILIGPSNAASWQDAFKYSFTPK